MAGIPYLSGLNRNEMKGICLICDKLVRLKTPYQKDWSNAAYPYTHKNKDGVYCEGRFYEVDKLIEDKTETNGNA